MWKCIGQTYHRYFFKSKMVYIQGNGIFFQFFLKGTKNALTLSWQRSLSHRKQSARYSIQSITPIYTIVSEKNGREAVAFLPRPKISAKLDQIFNWDFQMIAFTTTVFDEVQNWLHIIKKLKNLGFLDLSEKAKCGYLKTCLGALIVWTCFWYQHVFY